MLLGTNVLPWLPPRPPALLAPRREVPAVGGVQPTVTDKWLCPIRSADWPVPPTRGVSSPLPRPERADPRLRLRSGAPPSPHPRGKPPGAQVRRTVPHRVASHVPCWRLGSRSLANSKTLASRRARPTTQRGLLASPCTPGARHLHLPPALPEAARRLPDPCPAAGIAHPAPTLVLHCAQDEIQQILLSRQLRAPMFSPRCLWYWAGPGGGARRRREPHLCLPFHTTPQALRLSFPEAALS